MIKINLQIENKLIQNKIQGKQTLNIGKSQTTTTRQTSSNRLGSSDAIGNPVGVPRNKDTYKYLAYLYYYY